MGGAIQDDSQMCGLRLLELEDGHIVFEVSEPAIDSVWVLCLRVPAVFLRHTPDDISGDASAAPLPTRWLPSLSSVTQSRCHHVPRAKAHHEQGGT